MILRLALACCLALLALAARAADEPVATAQPGTPEFFTQRVRPILVNECLRCHGETRQKGDLKLNDRSAILKGGKNGPAMVVGDPEHSRMIVAVRYQDEDLQMPPDGRLSDADVQALADWIAAGALWVHPDGRSEGGAAATGGAPAATGGQPAATSQPASAGGNKQPPLIGRPHPMVIHFPIACLILALLAEFLFVAFGPAWEPTVKLLVTIGVLGTVAAVLTGTFFGEGTMFHRPDRTLATHELLGWLTLVLSLATGALLLASRSSPLARFYFRLALLATAIAISLTGHVGGMMSHPESAPF
jgi:uncharacterized membrane protein/cytochrome c553